MLKPFAVALFTAALAMVALPARAADAPVKITFFIWAGSNQGVVPREVIKAYTANNPKRDDRYSGIEQPDHLSENGRD